MQFIDLTKQQKKIRKGLELRINKVLNHGQYIMGPEIFELEEILANSVGVRHCISCSSGTDALLLLLMAKNIGPGDAIITTPFTYIATSEVISLLGATPVFVDIYKSTYNIDPLLIEKAIKLSIKNGLTPKGVISVDLFGLPARYRIINQVAKKFNIFIIEDAAQSLGSSIGNSKAGSFGDAAATSFFPSKPLGCYGDGGAVFTNNDLLAKEVRSIRIHGSGRTKYDNVRIGINGRLDSIQAAVLLEKLVIFEDEIYLRNKIAMRYTRGISDLFIKPHIPLNYNSSWAQYSILIPQLLNRDEIIFKLKEKGIPTMIYYKIPLHLQKVFLSLGYKMGDFPIVESISKRIISLPMHPYLSVKKQNMVINELNSLAKNLVQDV